MAKKIEGWCYNDTENKNPHFTEWTGPNEPVGWKDHPTRLTQQATLVIHDGPSERVYLESEVKAVFIGLSQRPGVSWQSLLKIAAKHGITL